MTTLDLRIYLLGPFRVMLAGREIEVSSEYRRVLLATLALSARRSVSIDTLARAIWSESPPERVRGSLQTHVMRLRRTLGPAVITTVPDGYRLDLSPGCVDALSFLAALDEAQNERNPCEERLLLGKALDLWRGDPLTGVDLAALRDDHRLRLTERFLAAVERRADLDLDAGSPDDLVGELGELVARHPLREPLWERLVRALLDSGRTAEALRCYADCRATLADELGVEPGVRLRELHLQALTQDRQVAPPAVRPHQLPRDIGGFTGRARELCATDGFLAAHRRGSAVIALIEGPPGVGKTSLAVRWANRVREAFPDGQLFIDLRGHAEGNPVGSYDALDTLLRSVGVDAAAVPSTVELRSALLRTTLDGRRVLIVLDNAGNADQVRPLLPGTGSAVLVTSRSQLRGLVAREGATRVPLRAFDAAEATDLLAGRLGRSQVDGDPAAAHALTELCGRLPLAISLAAERASRFPGLSMADLVRELEDEPARLTLLRDPNDIGADVRAAFTWSYRALSPRAAGVFRLLSLHPGQDFGSEWAAALCGIELPTTRNVLDELACAHLLNQPSIERYQFHDLLRVYARDLATVEEPEGSAGAAMHRVTGWYRRMAARLHQSIGVSRRLNEVIGDTTAGDGLADFADRTAALAWFQQERPALVELISTLAALGRHDEVWRLSWLLHSAFRTCYHNDDWLETGRLGMSAARARHDPLAEFHATNNLAAAGDSVGRWQESLAALQSTLARCRHDLDADAVAQILSNIGVTYGSLGECERSVEFHTEALALRRQCGGQVDVSLQQLAHVQLSLGRYTDCIASALEARRLFDEARHPYHAGINASVLARAYGRLGDPATARKYHRETIAHLRSAGFIQALAAVLIDYGHVMATRVKPTTPERHGSRHRWRSVSVIRGSPRSTPCSPTSAAATRRGRCHYPTCTQDIHRFAYVPFNTAESARTAAPVFVE